MSLPSGEKEWTEGFEATTAKMEAELDRKALEDLEETLQIWYSAARL